MQRPIRVQQFVLTPANDINSAGIDPTIDQKFSHRFCACLGQFSVISRRAGRIRMADDRETEFRKLISLQGLFELRELFLGFRLQVAGVDLERNVEIYLGFGFYADASRRRRFEPARGP